MNVAVLAASPRSIRFPDAALTPILGRVMIQVQLERLQRARAVDRVVLALSADVDDDRVVDAAREQRVEIHRSTHDDVLTRIHAAAAANAADHVVYVAADCPLADPAVIDLVLGEHIRRGVDFTSNTLETTYPVGLAVEVVRLAALAIAREEASPPERHAVTPFFRARHARFDLHSVELASDLSDRRWNCDGPGGLERVTGIFERVYPENPAFGVPEILALMDREPGMFA